LTIFLKEKQDRYIAQLLSMRGTLSMARNTEMEFTSGTKMNFISASSIKIYLMAKETSSQNSISTEETSPWAKKKGKASTRT